MGVYLSRGGVTAQRLNGPPCGFRRILIPWAKIHALLVRNWTHHAAVNVSRVSLCALFDLFSDYCSMPSASYDYPPISGTQYYLPPSKDIPDDLRCDCNTVMYKCEVRIPWSDPSLIYLRQVLTWRVPRVREQGSTRKILSSHVPVLIFDDFA